MKTLTLRTLGWLWEGTQCVLGFLGGFCGAFALLCLVFWAFEALQRAVS